MLLDDADVYLLNMEDRSDRLTDSRIELEKLGVESFNLVRPVSVSERGGWGSKAIRSCFESHWMIARESDRDRPFIVFEDDIARTCRAQQWWDALDQLESGDWDIAQFGWLRGQVTPTVVWGAWQRSFRGEVQGAHAYVVSPQGRGKWLDHLGEIGSQRFVDGVRSPMPLDGALNTFSWLEPSTRWLAVPSLVGQRASRSDLSPRWFDRVPVIRDAAEMWRRR